MSRLITRTIAIFAVCFALALAALGVAHASGTGYGSLPIPNAQPTATTPSDPQGNAPSITNVIPGSNPSASALPGDPAEPQEPADPQDQAEPQDQEVSGIVASSDSANSAFTLRTFAGTITVLVTKQTEFSDGLNTLADVHAGLNLSVEGYLQAGHLVATGIDGPSASNDPAETDGNNSAVDGN